MTTKAYNMIYSTTLNASRADLSTESSIRQPRRGLSRHRCSPVLVRALPAFLAAASLSGCTMELPFELDPDVVALSLLLESRAQSAHLWASYRRESDEAPPDISATLEGPGWTAEFAATDPTGEWCRLRYGSGICLRAQLPEQLAPGRYRIRGTTPLGSFSGEATVPATPRIENSPGDTLRIRLPAHFAGEVPIPLEYQVDSTTAALFLETARSRTIWEVDDSIWWRYERGNRPTRGLRLRLHALGPSYNRWIRHVGLNLDRPWPSFGIEGEGAYGLFGGVSAPTRWVHIVFEIEG